MSGEQLTEADLETRAWAVVAAVAEDRTGDVDQLLATLDRPDVEAVVYGIANAFVEVLADRYGLDGENPEDRAQVADRARRIVLRVASGDDHG